jgi:cytochrome-b5 reductase
MADPVVGALPPSVEELVKSLQDNQAGALLVILLSAVSGMLSVLYLYKLLLTPAKTLPLDDFVPMPLKKKEELSHDTVRFTFALPSPNHVLGLTVGQHVSLKFTDEDGNAVQRSYTPVTDDSTKGEFSLVIKVYKPNPPKFPEGGKMSQHLDSLKIGDTILVKGPKGHLQWKERGAFKVKPLGKPVEQRYSRQIGMMAGGTGITPMLQILHAIFRNPMNNHIECKLIYANQTEDDILVRQELEALARDFGGRFSLWYTVDRSDNNKDWKYDTGFINKDMIEKHLMFENNKDTQFFMCGPPPMIKFACVPALKELGFSEKDWVVF